MCGKEAIKADNEPGGSVSIADLDPCLLAAGPSDLLVLLLGLRGVSKSLVTEPAISLPSTGQLENDLKLT